MKDQKKSEALLTLVEIMTTLRSPAGCPWDQQQTAETLKPYILEEAYELIEAIDSNNTIDIRDELGDLLLQVVFISQIFSEQNKFGLAEVADSICNKLIRRHPHVFTNAPSHEHATHWEKIKQQERSAQGKGEKLKDCIPATLPALKKATKVVKKMGIDHHASPIDNITTVLQQLTRQIEEPGETDKTNLKNIFGEFLFATVELASSLQFDAEDLLRKKTTQIITEFDT